MIQYVDCLTNNLRSSSLALLNRYDRITSLFEQSLPYSEQTPYTEILVASEQDTCWRAALSLKVTDLSYKQSVSLHSLVCILTLLLPFITDVTLKIQQPETK